MKSGSKIIRTLFTGIAFAGIVFANNSFANDDFANNDENKNSWPCTQVYTENISIGTIWQGEKLGERLKTWWEDDAVIEGVKALSNPTLDEKRMGEEVQKFAAAQSSSDSKKERLLNLFAGLYTSAMEKRSNQLVSILRFSARQDQLTASISDRSNRLRELRKQEVAMDNEQYVALQTELDWYGRIFDERLNLTEYICEEPVLLVQRLGFASRAIQAELK